MGALLDDARSARSSRSARYGVRHCRTRTAAVRTLEAAYGKVPARCGRHDAAVEISEAHDTCARTAPLHRTNSLVGFTDIGVICLSCHRSRRSSRSRRSIAKSGRTGRSGRSGRSKGGRRPQRPQRMPPTDSHNEGYLAFRREARARRQATVGHMGGRGALTIRARRQAARNAGVGVGLVGGVRGVTAEWERG